MPQIETLAIVLQTRPWRETSLIAELLTRSRGRVGAIARGAKRKGHAESANLQPGAIVNARLSVRGQDSLATLTALDLEAAPPAARARRAGFTSPGDLLARSAYAGLYGEILHQSLENDPHAEALFDTARDFFQTLGETPHPGSYALTALFGLLEALGFGLNLPDAPEDHAGNIKIDLLNATAETTSERTGHSRENAYVLSATAFRALCEIFRSLQRGETLTVGRSVGPEIARLAIALFEAHLETRLKSAHYLEEMVLRPLETPLVKPLTKPGDVGLE